MKHLILLAMISISTLSSADDGGNSGGGGGNICLNPNTNRWQMLEEVIYPSNAPTSFSEGTKIKAPKLVPELKREINLVDLTKMGPAISARQKLNRVYGAANMAKYLDEAFLMLTHTYVENLNPIRPIEADTNGTSACGSNNTRAILVSNGRDSILAYSLWNSLSLESQEILVIHETLRLASVLYSAFTSMTNADIQKLTMEIYAGKANLPNYRFYSQYVSRTTFVSVRDWIWNMEIPTFVKFCNDKNNQAGFIGYAKINNATQRGTKKIYDLCESFRSGKDHQDFIPVAEEKEGAYEQGLTYDFYIQIHSIEDYYNCHESDKGEAYDPFDDKQFDACVATINKLFPKKILREKSEELENIQIEIAKAVYKGRAPINDYYSAPDLNRVRENILEEKKNIDGKIRTANR